MLKVMNPATEEVIRELEEDSPEEIARKVARARAAQPRWAEVPLPERLGAIQRFRSVLEARHEELSRLLTSEVGKPISQSRNELAGVLSRIDFFLRATPIELEPERIGAPEESAGTEELVAHEPLGVIANVSAWNYPYFVGSNVFVPALLTGNAVLYKPSEHSTLTGLAITDALHESGVPRDLMLPVIGDGAVGAELVGQRLDGVFFTGSYATGRRIAQAIASRLIRVGLELGGKDPIYVCEDVDVAHAAASLAEGAFYNAGQSCCSVERIYVHRKVHSEFIERFVGEVRGFKLGDPREESTFIGPLARSAQLDLLDGQVQDALAKGACLRLGGERKAGRGWYYLPTVLTGVDHSMRVMREESFGPIIGIQVVESDEEAIRLMNDTEYGLTAGVYTRDRARAESLLARVSAGSAYWNCCDRVSPRLPWSGRRNSGVGSTLGRAGIRAFTQPKAYHLRSA